ncbi:YifB family Mg chelatase-like AAA ATPase [Cylindrospermopsis raciborskii]|uniref:Magnesium chelatase n=2 Tax=Cylindrospermopsis raciborskii TaxID=77022 RepID=A0A9Q5QWM4_9CYAN|nr:YifB family Mg chelatase-like AAA ATPase [Cylindrospermopsis raciborskii]NLQ05787.1 YifB family Mg chelatase-like AAA ATPase [Cylindrospermopsis raciborskii MVCC19]OHY36301.1 magnesium chelatase [Cylindrospermopsis raciborskii MVCC14]OPH09849.1 magnesium chelatase [Cylindrospermopsis raciborskii CENA302]
MLSRVWSASIVGIDAVKVGVEVDISGGGLPGIIILGLPDSAIQESKERVKATLRNAGFNVPARKIVINLTPADLRKEGPAFDVPISIGILAASEQVNLDLLGEFLFLGEVSLDGTLLPVTGVLPIAAAAEKLGIRSLVVPMENTQEAAVVEGLNVYGCTSILQVVDLLNNIKNYKKISLKTTQESLLSTSSNSADLQDVKGQSHARRALEIAAAGGHNLIFVGPPGSGKTMLARRLPGILPPLEFSESLEVTRIHSVAGLLKNRGSLVRERPFRSPHHSASGPSLVGGGSFPRPGEISLSHRGVLFLDELTEFKRDVLEFLRQPLEDGYVTISRTRQSVVFPAQFTLVASTNPCPCGYYGDGIQPCTCSPRQREQYWAKLSGPLMDRIDLQVAVNRLKPEEITRETRGEPSKIVRERVQKVRSVTNLRFQSEPHVKCNAHMQSRHLQKWCKLDDTSRKLLENAITRLGLSARASDRILKVARTIADLADEENLKSQHVAEAIQYRTIDRMQ